MAGMLKIKGPAATVAVTATPQSVDIASPGRTHTLRNAGTGSVYILFSSGDIAKTNTTKFAGLEAALLALGAVEIEAGASLVIEDMPPWFHAVCATGGTATLQVYVGVPDRLEEHYGAVGAAADADGNVHGQLRYIGEAVTTGVKSWEGYTTERVSIAQGAAGRTTIKALVAGKVIYLRRLFLMSDAGAATVKVCYDDDGAGTGEGDLTGDMPVAANGGPPPISEDDPDCCIQTPAEKYLTLFSATGKMFGRAVISYLT